MATFSNVPWSKVAILGMVIPPFNRNPCNGYINPYYWVDDHPLLCGNNGSLDPGTNGATASSVSNKSLRLGFDQGHAHLAYSHSNHDSSFLHKTESNGLLSELDITIL